MITPCMTALPFEMPWKEIQHEGRPAPRPRPRPFPRSHPACTVSFKVHDLPLEIYALYYTEYPIGALFSELVT